MQKSGFPKMRHYVGFSQIGSHIMCSKFERGPLRSCPHQANCLVCASTNVALILNKLLNEIYNIHSTYIRNELINIIFACSNRSLNPLFY